MTIQMPAARVVIYGDFNCPFSALASNRAARLERSGEASVDWRAVEHDPDIPPSGQAITGMLADELDGELERVRGLLQPDERMPLQRPPVRSNTGAAVAAYAGLPPDRRTLARAELFRRYWEAGENLAEPAVLAAAGLGPGSPATARTWHQEWRDLGPPVVPVVVLPDGAVHRGFDGLDWLAEQTSG